MSVDYVGSVVLEVNGREYPISKFDTQLETGNKLVPTMNSTGHPLGMSRGTKKYSVSFSMPVDITDDTDWAELQNAIIVIYPLNAESKRTLFLGVGIESVGDAYALDAEMMRDLKGFATDKQFI